MSPWCRPASSRTWNREPLIQIVIVHSRGGRPGAVFDRRSVALTLGYSRRSLTSGTSARSRLLRSLLEPGGQALESRHLLAGARHVEWVLLLVEPCIYEELKMEEPHPGVAHAALRG